mmetsp:Transcript_13536/g.29724  ORF Transcript_13536/g.29724 Transcript_13536/m.29724 type:complete len:229 (+) Transcript_13536:851-1537(+)
MLKLLHRRGALAAQLRDDLELAPELGKLLCLASQPILEGADSSLQRCCRLEAIPERPELKELYVQVGPRGSNLGRAVTELRHGLYGLKASSQLIDLTGLHPEGLLESCDVLVAWQLRNPRGNFCHPKRMLIQSPTELAGLRRLQGTVFLAELLQDFPNLRLELTWMATHSPLQVFHVSLECPHSRFHGFDAGLPSFFRGWRLRTRECEAAAPIATALVKDRRTPALLV